MIFHGSNSLSPFIFWQKWFFILCTSPPIIRNMARTKICRVPKSAPTNTVWPNKTIVYLGNPIFTNGAFVGLCVTTIFAFGPITISLFVSELRPLKRGRPLFFWKSLPGPTVWLCLSLTTLAYAGVGWAGWCCLFIDFIDLLRILFWNVNRQSSQRKGLHLKGFSTLHIILYSNL